MSEERKVMCRCGKGMELRYIGRNQRGNRARYHCSCGWKSPTRCGDTEAHAAEAAYLAATRRPPNRPLTEEQIMQCAVNVPLFCIYATDQECRCVVFASDIQVEYKYRAEMGQMFFRDFPTPADIEAARKEQPNDHT